MSNVFGTDKDIAKIPTVLNSARHEELILRISRKSENIFFFVVKGLTILKIKNYSYMHSLVSTRSFLPMALQLTYFVALSL